MTIDIEPLKKQLGRKIEDEDVVTQAPLKAMIATFDRPDKAPAEGEPIAPGWHLCFLHSYARPAQLGQGRRGLHRRRAARDPDAAAHVCRLDLHLRRRHPGRRQAPARDRVHRHPAAQGSTGTLIVTTQTRRIFTPRGLALTEAASTVFREEVKAGEKSGVPVRDAAPSRRAVAAHHHARAR